MLTSLEGLRCDSGVPGRDSLDGGRSSVEILRWGGRGLSGVMSRDPLLGLEYLSSPSTVMYGIGTSRDGFCLTGVPGRSS